MTTKQLIEFDFWCTCDIDDGDEGHSEECELHLCTEWVAGRASWYHGELWDNEELWGWGAEEAVTEVELVEPKKNPDDDKYECDCFDPKDTSVQFNSRHDASCALENHTAWMNAECEWDHPTRTFVYFDKDPLDTKTTKTTKSSYGGGWGVGAGGDYYGGGFHKTCTHDGTTPVTFPNGVKVYPSSSYDTKARETVPDYALYLETSRLPHSLATYIPWRDYGLPTINFHHAAEAMIEAYRMAEAGMTVEVGCIGAHGRTGTVLACMAVLAGVPDDQAVEWVQDNHCRSAVEGERQVWFVSWFAAYVSGTEAPPTPPPPAPLPPAKSTTKPLPQSTTLPFRDTPAPTSLPKVGPICPECAVVIEDHPLDGYQCWNVHCRRFHIKSSSPAAKKGIFKKGRKKHS